MSSADEDDIHPVSGMRQISLHSLHSRETWQHFIDHVRQAALKETSADISIFGDDDNRYLVINLYHSANSSSEYYFSAENSANPLNVLLTALDTLNYSLVRLLEYLHQETTMDAEGRAFLKLDQIIIFKSEYRAA